MATWTPKYFVTTRDVIDIPRGTTLSPDQFDDDVYRYIGENGHPRRVSLVEMKYFPDAFEETYPNCQAVLRAFGLEGRVWISRRDHEINIPYCLHPLTEQSPRGVARFADSGREDDCHRPIFDLVSLN